MVPAIGFSFWPRFLHSGAGYRRGARQRHFTLRVDLLRASALSDPVCAQFIQGRESDCRGSERPANLPAVVDEPCLSREVLAAIRGKTVPSGVRLSREIVGSGVILLDRHGRKRRQHGVCGDEPQRIHACETLGAQDVPTPTVGCHMPVDRRLRRPDRKVRRGVGDVEKPRVTLGRPGLALQLQRVDWCKLDSWTAGRWSPVLGMRTSSLELHPALDSTSKSNGEAAIAGYAKRESSDAPIEDAGRRIGHTLLQNAGRGDSRLFFKKTPHRDAAGKREVPSAAWRR